jgi:hypothetical protein
MTEIDEVEMFISELARVAKEIEYETDTIPGESAYVKGLFLEAIEHIERASGMLKTAKKEMGK